MMSRVSLKKRSDVVLKENQKHWLECGKLWQQSSFEELYMLELPSCNDFAEAHILLFVYKKILCMS